MPAAAAAINAVNTLRKAESGTASGAPSFYTGSGKDDDVSGGVKFQGGKKGKVALITILVMLFGGGAFLGSSNSLLAPAIESLYTTSTDTQYTSASMRASRIFKNASTGAVSTNWRGAKVYTKMSGTFKRRLAKNGIDVSGIGSNRKLTFNGQEITAADFDTKFKNDPDFRDAFTKAKRGRVATFFDNIANKILTKLGISRNLFKNFKQTGDIDVDTQSYKNTMSKKFSNNTTTLDGVDRTRPSDADPDDPDPNAKHTGSSTADSNGSGSTSKAKAMLESVGNTISVIGNVICTVMKFGNAVSVLVAANEIYQSINYFMGLTENISKMKSGQGDASAINEILNFFSTTSETKVDDITKLEVTGAFGGDTEQNATVPSNITLTEDGELKQKGSPLESEGMQMVLTQSFSTPKNSGAYSLERVTNSIGMMLTGTATSAAVCAGVGIATNIVSIALQIMSFGAAKAVASVGKLALSATFSIAVSVIAGFLAPTIAQVFFTNAFDNATGIPAGELFTKGASASNTRLGRNGSGQSVSGQKAAIAYNQATNTVLAMDAELDRLNHSPFDITNKNTFFGSIAYSLLPLTLKTSGVSTVSSLINTTTSAIASTLSNVRAEGEQTSYMTNFGNCPTLEEIGVVGDMYCNPVTTTDLTTIDLDPFAENSQETKQYWKVLTEDTFVIPLKNGQMTTTNLTCDEQGNCKVNAGSPLANYITFCDNRDSPFGVVDQNILGALQPTSNAGAVGNAILGVIPILGDVLDIINNSNDLINIDMATGQRCGNTDKNSTYWQNEGKYYQRYIEDMRLVEQMGAFEEDGTKNPVTAFEEEYEALHPADNSYEGYLARISGLTKENVEATLALMDYFNFINDYDATTRIAMTQKLLTEESSEEVVARLENDKPYKFSDPAIIKTSHEATFVAKNFVIYTDIRNRSFAA